MKILRAVNVQLRRVVSWKLLACILLFAALQGIAASKEMVTGPGDSAMFYFISGQSGTTAILFLILPAVPFAMSLAQEWEAHASPYWAVRSGEGVYTLSKLFGGAAAGFLAVGGGSLLFLLLAGTLAGHGNFGVSERFSGLIYEELLGQGHIVLGHALLILHHALSGATVGMLGTFFTILFPDPFVAVAAPLSFEMLITRFLTHSPIPRFTILWPGYWFADVPIEGGAAYQIFGQKVLATLLLCGLLCLIGVPAMKRRFAHA